MRILTTILTFHILLLTVFPSFSSVFISVEKSECTESDCCQKEKSADDDTCPDNKDCCMTTCNPFMVCCNCNAVVSQKQIISTPVSFAEQKHFSFPSENGCDYTAEAWNPPKTV